MSGSSAQCAALVAHGNCFLNSAREVPELTSTNSTFQYVRATRFLQPSSWRLFGRERHLKLVTQGTVGWFERLKSTGVYRLSLFTGEPSSRELLLPPHVSFTFFGSRHWAILAEARGRSQAWLSHWHCVKTEDKKRWVVRYIAGHK